MLNNRPDITFKFTIEEANYILNALARCPYIEVHKIITKMQEQAKNAKAGEKCES